MKNIAIILAGGSGYRFNDNTPKQFLFLKDRRIIDYSITTFSNHPDIDDIIIVCNQDWMKIMENEYSKCTIVRGGKTRQESSLIGLLACPESTNIVLIHDAARPFVTSDYITELLELLKQYQAVNLSIKAKDTIVCVKNNIITSIPNRDDIHLSQTPQAFRYQTILNAHKKTNNIDCTDDIQLVKNMNIDCFNLEGSIDNIKVTYNNDLKIAELIINRKNDKGI